MRARLACVVLAFTTTPALAQHQDTDEATLPGTWEGTFNSEAVGTGGMKLVITKEGGWKAVITLSRDETMSADAMGFTVKGNELSWSLGLHGTSCETTATREGSVIKGETACGGHAAFAFELRKAT